MTSDEVSPLSDESPAEACARCLGSGLVTGPTLCPECGGSGYGVPENSYDYNLRRLIAWARRTPTEG